MNHEEHLMNQTGATLRLPLEDWARVIAVLWSTALIHPDQLETIGRLGSRLYAQYARALGGDPEQVPDWLHCLPAAIRQQVRASATRAGDQGQETHRG